MAEPACRVHVWPGCERVLQGEAKVQVQEARAERGAGSLRSMRSGRAAGALHARARARAPHMHSYMRRDRARKPIPSRLQAAEGEAAAGHGGSKALRATALRALRRLVGAAGREGDALAFVLPGVASGLLRALLAAGAAARAPCT